ncbi:MAG: hypothetical protein J6V25_11920, partial [Oscillospiraceae bacterium]|nr:hypothetical protein [Oscillospiraceae bacterium]
KSKSTGTILKPGFAPAEQYNSRANLGTWTDVYAVSASCHYLLTGKVPADVHERMDLGEQLTELRANPHISQVLINALENGMKIRSSDRIQTVEELYCQLYTKRTAPKVHKLRKATIALAAAGACILAACFLPLTRSANVPETALAEENTTAHVLFDTQESAYQQACTLMEQELYEEAMAIFAQLGDYKDCAIRFEQCQQQTVLQQQYEEASAMAEQGQLGKAAIAFAKLGTYRDAKSRSLALWKQMPGRVTISFWNGGSDMMLHALRADGTIAVDTLDSDSVSEEYLEKYFTAGYTDIVSIHGPIGLRYDGTLALPSAGSQYRELEGWSDIVALSVRYCDFPGNTYVGLKSDGTVVAAGYSEDGQCDVEGWTDIVAVSCGQGYTVGLKADGTLVTAGHNEYGQCNVQDWKNIVDISTATNAHVTYGLTADGRVLTAGVNQWDDVVKVSRWKNIRAIYDNCGICDDGTMVSTAIDSRKLSAYNDMAAMIYMNKMPVCLRMNGTLVFLDLQEGQFARARTWQDIQIPAFPITDF